MIDGDNEIERVGVIDGVRVADIDIVGVIVGVIDGVLVADIDKLGVADIDKLGVTDGVLVADIDKLGVAEIDNEGVIDGVLVAEIDTLGVDDIDKLGVTDGVGDEGISSDKTILNPPVLFRSIISNTIFMLLFHMHFFPYVYYLHMLEQTHLQCYHIL